MENKPDCAQMEDELWAEYTRQENKKYFSMDPTIKTAKLSIARDINRNPSDDFYRALILIENEYEVPKEFATIYERLSTDDITLLARMGYVLKSDSITEIILPDKVDRAMRRALLEDHGLYDSYRSQWLDMDYQRFSMCGFH